MPGPIKKQGSVNAQTEAEKAHAHAYPSQTPALTGPIKRSLTNEHNQEKSMADNHARKQAELAAKAAAKAEGGGRRMRRSRRSRRSRRGRRTQKRNRSLRKRSGRSLRRRRGRRSRRM